MLPQSWVHTMEVTLVRLPLYAAKNNVLTTGEGKIYQKSSEVAPVDGNKPSLHILVIINFYYYID